MKYTRVIARLDIKGPNLVKGIHLEGLRVLGNPASFAKAYYEAGIDELIYQDVVASLYERNSLHEFIKQTSEEILIPITVGGGIRNIEDIKNVLRSGADKVCINTAAIANPELIRMAANKFGSSTIVIALETIKNPNGKHLCYTDNGREFTGVDAIDWAQRVEYLGAGEILVTSIDKDGTGEGFDNDFINKISSMLSIPVIAHGGAGKLDHLTSAIENKADAIAIASMLHYRYVDELSQHYKSIEEGNTEFLMNLRTPKKISPRRIGEIKNYLNNNGLPCRP